MFSSRLRQGPGRNRLALALSHRRAAGLPIVDLTESNPTRAGFAYPAGLLETLSQDSALCYQPQPFGLPAAREAVAADFTRRGVSVPENRILLTTSTSEAYCLLFKLLCDPGDVVLAPRPSYPLIEYLTELDGVSVEHYNLDYHGRWSVDVDDVREKLRAPGGGRRIRAIITISPHNPTGSTLSTVELEALSALARAHEVALIADEVFADYALTDRPVTSLLTQDVALTFGLGGLSKSAGLPQIKLGWIGVSGPNTLVVEAMERLETISDAYLSVSTPVQVAAADLLKNGSSVRAQIQKRIRANYRRLRDAAGAHPSCSVLTSEAGWYAVVQVPAMKSEETLVLDLLERTGILVHPGYFFDFEREAFLVISLLPDSLTFSPAVETLLSEVGGQVPFSPTRAKKAPDPFAS
jgi:alanine-synthesizing transaminase